MFILYACCDSSGESSIKVISGGGPRVLPKRAYIPDDIAWSVWIVPGAVME